MTDITMDVDTKALRQRILTLAIQGKLTDQRKEDGNAQDLYNQIQEEKQKLIKEKKIKKSKSLQVITEDEIPFEIPENWMWVRLGNIIKVSSGDSLPARAMKKGIVPVFGGNGITGYHNSFNVEKATIVIGRVGFYCGSIHITPDRAWVTDNAFITNYSELNICQQYLFYALKCMKLGDKASSTAQPVVSGRKIYPRLFPLPPLAEQKRIADKISALFAQLDAIDKAYGEYRELQQTMKSRLLEQAIQGKLTDQRKEDGNAQDLYNQIQEEKQKLIKEKKIKKEKTLPEITADEIPFDIPKNWMWVRLGRLITVISGVSYKKKDVCEAGVRILRGGNIQNLKVNISASDVFLPNMYFDKTKQVKVGDVLIVASTGSKTVIGKPGYIEYELPRTMIGAFLRICRPICKETSTYLYRIFCSEYYRQHIRHLAQGTNINNVKEEYITKLMIPLPPLAEQKRIVEKLDKLLPLCET